MQKFLSLLITAAFLYAIIQFKSGEKVTTPPLSQPPSPAATAAVPVIEHSVASPLPATSPAEGNFFEKTLSNVLMNVLKTEEGRMFFENILQPLNTPLAGTNHSFKINNTDLINTMFRINTVGQGIIGPASCGHIVNVYYQILTMSNNIVEEQTKTFTLGARAIIPGIDSVIIGMMVGQTRQAVIPSSYAYHEEKYRKGGVDHEASYKVNITLKEILPKNFARYEEVRIFDDEISYKMPLLCGDRVAFDAKIVKLSNGHLVFDSQAKNQKIEMRLGDINYPMIFSYALHGKIPVGTRTVIAKGRSFKALGSHHNKLITKELLSPDEYFMLELNQFEKR